MKVPFVHVIWYTFLQRAICESFFESTVKSWWSGGRWQSFETFLPAFTCWLNPPRKLETRYTLCVASCLSFKCTRYQRFKDGIFVKRSWLTSRKETSFALFRLCDVSAAFLFSRLFLPPASQPHPHVCHGCVHISVPNKGVATAIFILHGFFLSPSVPGFSRPRRTKDVFEQSRSTNISLSVIIVVILRGCGNGERKKVVRITRDMIKTRRSVEIARSEWNLSNNTVVSCPD